MIIVILVFIAIAASAGIWRAQQDVHRNWVSYFGELLCSVLLTMSLVILMELLYEHITGTTPMQLTVEEQQTIKQMRTTKKIQQLKKELHELESRSTETVQQVR